MQLLASLAERRLEGDERAVEPAPLVADGLRRELEHTRMQAVEQDTDAASRHLAPLEQRPRALVVDGVVDHTPKRVAARARQSELHHGEVSRRRVDVASNHLLDLLRRRAQRACRRAQPAQHRVALSDIDHRLRDGRRVGVRPKRVLPH
eukprot:7390689-Prymnesium_polylepis.2